MAASARAAKQLTVFRGILRELGHGKLIGSPSYRYMLEKYKSNQITAGRFCREQFAASHDASTYYCLLRSSREYDELITKYHGDGEDSVKKAAARVGLGLPETYQENELENKTDPINSDL